MNHSNFYKKLKQARLDAKIKQDFVAKKLIIPVSAVSAIENGNRRLDIFEMITLAEIYKKDINWFIETGNEENKSQSYNKNTILKTAYQFIDQAPPELQTAIAYAVIGFFKNYQK